MHRRSASATRKTTTKRYDVDSDAVGTEESEAAAAAGRGRLRDGRGADVPTALLVGATRSTRSGDAEATTRGMRADEIVARR